MPSHNTTPLACKQLFLRDAIARDLSVEQIRGLVELHHELTGPCFARAPGMGKHHRDAMGQDQLTGHGKQTTRYEMY